MWSVLVSILVGFFVAIISPVEYESSSSLLLENNNIQASGGLLSQYGEMFGLGGINQNQSALTPNLYPEITQALPFQTSLMKEELKFSNTDTTLSVFGFFDELYDPPIIETVKKYTIGLPSVIGNAFSSSPSRANSSVMGQEKVNSSILNVTADTLYVYSKLKDRITVKVENGMLNITSLMPDPYAAANLGAATVELLKENIKEYRTQKAVQNLEYAKKQLKEAEKNFRGAQKKLAEFQDSNINLATASAKTKLQQLESEYDLAFNIYNTLAKRVEELKLKVQEETPVFTTIEPFEVPRDNSKPRVKLILFATVFLGLVGSMGYLLVKEPLYKLWKSDF